MQREIQSEGEECEESWIRKWRYAALKTIVQRVVDDDRLTDVYWWSEIREVELWENERCVRLIPQKTSIGRITIVHVCSYATIRLSNGMDIILKTVSVLLTGHCQ
jgi:hypothetical protein